MPLSFHNAEDPPTYAAQAVPDTTDFSAITGALAATGVVSGCTVSPTSPSTSMGVTVANGVILSQGTQATVGSGTFSIAAASPTDRRDIVVASSSGVVSVITGSPGGVANWIPTSGLDPPIKPSLPDSTYVLLGEVYVQAGASTIAAGNITDKTTTVLGQQTPIVLFPQTSYIAGASPANTKRAIFVLASGNGAFSGGLASYTDFCNRFVFTLPVTPTRCRIRIRNWNLWSGGASTSPVQIAGIFWGAPTEAAYWDGTFSALPTEVDPGNGSPVDIGTTEYVGPWFTPPGTAVAYQRQAISIGYLAPSGGVNAGGPGGFVWNGSGTAAVAGATTAPGTTLVGDPTTTTGLQAFDVRLEYEFVGSNQLGLFLGTSLTVGLIGSGNNAASPGQDHAWPNQVGRRIGHCIMNSGQDGGALGLNVFSINDPLLQRMYDTSWQVGDPALWPAGCVPDYCLLHYPFNDLGSNTLATLQGYILRVVNIIKSTGINKILLATELPTGQPVGFLTGRIPSGTSASTTITIQGYPFPANGMGVPNGGSPGPSSGWVNQGIWLEYPASGVLDGPFKVSAATTSGQLTLTQFPAIPPQIGFPGTPAGPTSFANNHEVGAAVFQYAEGMRHQYNYWVRSGVYDISGVVDIATLAEIGSTPPTTQSPLWYGNVSNPHLSAAGYAGIGQHLASTFAGI